MEGDDRGVELRDRTKTFAHRCVKFSAALRHSIRLCNSSTRFEDSEQCTACLSFVDHAAGTSISDRVTSVIFMFVHIV